MTEKKTSKITTTSPDDIFVPIALPIYGTYNDYGGLDVIEDYDWMVDNNIEGYDLNIKTIRDVFGCKFEEFFQKIYPNKYKRNDDDYIVILKSFMKCYRENRYSFGLTFDENKMEFTFIMEHKFIYDGNDGTPTTYHSDFLYYYQTDNNFGVSWRCGGAHNNYTAGITTINVKTTDIIDSNMCGCSLCEFNNESFSIIPVKL